MNAPTSLSVRPLSVPTVLITIIIAGSASPPVIIAGARILPVVILTALLLFILASGRLTVGRRRLDKPLILMLSGLGAAAGLSLLGSLQAGLSPQVLKLSILLFQYTMALLAFLVASEVRLTFLAWGCAGIGAAYGGLLILQSAGLIPGANEVEILGSGFLRAQLFFGQPNGSAAYLGTALPLTFLVRPQCTWQHILLWLFRIAILIGLIATFSRSAMAASLVVLAITAILASARFARVSRYCLLGVLVVLMVCSLDVTIYSLIELITASGSALDSDYSAVERYGLGLAGIQIFYAQPWFGVGVGNYPAALGHFDSTIDTSLNIPHNTAIQFACEQGFFGVMAFSGVLISLLRNSKAAARPAVFPLLWAAWTIVFNSWFGWPFIHGLGESFMIILGLLAYHARRTTI